MRPMATLRLVRNVLPRPGRQDPPLRNQTLFAMAIDARACGRERLTSSSSPFSTGAASTIAGGASFLILAARAAGAGLLGTLLAKQ